MTRAPDISSSIEHEAQLAIVAARLRGHGKLSPRQFEAILTHLDQVEQVASHKDEEADDLVRLRWSAEQVVAGWRDFGTADWDEKEFGALVAELDLWT